MSGRNNALDTPNTIFRAPLVAPPLKSISSEELAPGAADAMADDAGVAEVAYFLAQRPHQSNLTDLSHVPRIRLS